MSKDGKLLKLILLFLNFTFSLCGLLVITQSSLTLIQDGPYLEFAGSKFTAHLVLLVVIGTLTFAAGVCGFYATIKEKCCVLIIVVLTIIILLFAEIGTLITNLARTDDIAEDIKKTLFDVMLQYPTNDSNRRIRFDTIQYDFNCCGTNSFHDWVVVLGSQTNFSVPLSCCKDVEVCQNFDVPLDESLSNLPIYTKGCSQALTEFIYASRVSVVAACIVTTLIEIPCVITLSYFVWREKISKVIIYQAVLTQSP